MSYGVRRTKADSVSVSSWYKANPSSEAEGKVKVRILLGQQFLVNWLIGFGGG